jgi:hypothetical protein
MLRVNNEPSLRNEEFHTLVNIYHQKRVILNLFIKLKTGVPRGFHCMPHFIFFFNLVNDIIILIG